MRNPPAAAGFANDTHIDPGRAMPVPRFSRRRLLTTGAAVTAAALGGDAVTDPTRADTYTGSVPWEPGEANAPRPVVPGPLQFFSKEESEFIDAAVARLIPADELGPGAKEAGVTVFLDRQLAGPYGQGQTWYMQGPWQAGDKTQGYQSRLTPAQLYRAAIQSVDDHCRDKFQGKRFTELSEDQQDQILTAMEKGNIKLTGLGTHPVEIEGMKSDGFLLLLMQNTTEGYFSDPLYGGNRDMVGWKLIGFPGARYDYREYVSQHGKKLALEPVGILGRPGWNPNQGKS
jgi:gluconate 2-dehydrogenase gamma chain